MSIETNISQELVASTAGLSHDISFRDVDGKPTVDDSKAVYIYLMDRGILLLIKNDQKDVEIWFEPSAETADWIKNTLKPYVQATAKKFLYGITLKSYAGDIEPKNFVHRTEVKESRNTTKTSYHPLGETKIIIRHSKAVIEEKPGSRSRNIGDIFIEHRGERFRYPHKHLMAARVMALHVDKGGKPWDQLGEKILEISRRRKEIMELLRWSKRLDNSSQIEEIQSRGQSEVMMLRRILEKSARTGNLESVIEYQLPARKPVTENELNIITKRSLRTSAIPGLELVPLKGLVTEVLEELNKKLLV
jgi:hypothetical protein